MINVRRQPTNNAKVGVVFFAAYIIHFAHNHGHNLTGPVSAVLLVVATLISAFFLFVAPIPQPQVYHDFADKRTFICSCAAKGGFFLPPGAESERKGFIIKNFGDVLSNLVIFAGGVRGLALLQVGNTDFAVGSIREWQQQVCLPILFSSTVAISAGSAYYHWNPNDSTLVWDRLPMTVAFVSTFCYMLEEYIPDVGIGQSLLAPLLLLGMFSVLYWSWADDLRLYALIQFLPLVIIAGLLVCRRPKHGGAAHHAFALVSYGLAKVCEERDYEIFSWTRQRVSGHTLKHVLAGMATMSIASLLL